jgi:flagellar protein FliS
VSRELQEVGMTGFGAKAYQRVDKDSSVAAADPHRLVLMLFDGVLEAIRLAESHIAAGRVADKGQALGKAVRIVEEGLKASLDRAAGGALATQLSALYDYATLRLLQAHLRNDHGALAEVAVLLTDLRAAWASIGGASGPAGSAGAAASPQRPVVAATSPAARFLSADGGAGAQRLVVTA